MKLFGFEINRKTSAAIKNSGSGVGNTCDYGSDYSEWLNGGLSGGVAVTEKTVLTISSVYSCVNLIAGAISSLPLPVFERGDNSDRRRIGGTISKLINQTPNDNMTAAVFWEYIVASLLLKGGSFARIIRGDVFSGFEPIALEPINPDIVEIKSAGGNLVYIVQYSQLDGDNRGRAVIHQDDMLHIPGPGYDGKNGQSQIKHALRSSASIALATESYSSEFFKNGAKPDFAIEMEGKPTPEQIAELRRVWGEKHQGIGKNHLPGLLYGGSKIHELTMNAEDAQLIGTRQFQVEDIARIFGVPPVMIGHSTGTSMWGTGVEALGIGFVKYTLARHLVKIEQELNRKLFIDENHFTEFVTAGLERGDIKTRFGAYRIALGRAGEEAWMKPSEVRKLENLPTNEDFDNQLKGVDSETPVEQPNNDE